MTISNGRVRAAAGKNRRGCTEEESCFHRHRPLSNLEISESGGQQEDCSYTGPCKTNRKHKRGARMFRVHETILSLLTKVIKTITTLIGRTNCKPQIKNISLPFTSHNFFMYPFPLYTTSYSQRMRSNRKHRIKTKRAGGLCTLYSHSSNNLPKSLKIQSHIPQNTTAQKSSSTAPNAKRKISPSLLLPQRRRVHDLIH